MTDVAGSSNVLLMPPHILLGLTCGQVSAGEARGHLAAVADTFGPSAAESVATDLARSALGLIRAGHRDPQRLADDVIAVCSAVGGRWAR